MPPILPTLPRPSNPLGSLPLVICRGELKHELVLLEQAVDVGDVQAAAGGNALFAAGVEDAGVFPLLGGHRENDGLLTAQKLLVHLGSAICLPS